jgi:hypothetical protein
VQETDRRDSVMPLQSPAVAAFSPLPSLRATSVDLEGLESGSLPDRGGSVTSHSSVMNLFDYGSYLSSEHPVVETQPQMRPASRTQQRLATGGWSRAPAPYRAIHPPSTVARSPLRHSHRFNERRINETMPSMLHPRGPNERRITERPIHRIHLCPILTTMSSQPVLHQWIPVSGGSSPATAKQLLAALETLLETIAALPEDEKEDMVISWRTSTQAGSRMKTGFFKLSKVLFESRIHFARRDTGTVEDL